MIAYLGKGTLYRLVSAAGFSDKMMLGADIQVDLRTFTEDGALYRFTNGIEIYVLDADEVQPT